MQTGMTPVLTKEVARRITKGRTALVPVEYEMAIQCLTECTTLDESKYWSDKADALAAWAQIYHSDEAQRKAKMLKLHAYRRMGQLAGELRPGHSNGRHGSAPGPVSLLIEQGLRERDASAARKLATLTERQFGKLLKHPLAPTTVVGRLTGTEPAWGDLQRLAMSLRAYCRLNEARDVAEALDPKRYETARGIAKDLIEWFDEFDQHLEKLNGRA